MVPEIWSVKDTIFWHLGLFFALLLLQQPEKSKFWKNKKTALRNYHFTHVYHKWKSYDTWFLRYGVWQTIFCHFGPFFALLPPNNPKNQNFDNMKKTHGDIIILHVCTINEKNWRSQNFDFLGLKNLSLCQFLGAPTSEDVIEF